MKLYDVPCHALKAGDKIDLHHEQSGFYTVLRVRALASNLLAFAVPSEDDESIEILVRRNPVGRLTFDTKYIYRTINDTLTKLEA